MASHETYEVSIERDAREENEIANYHLIVGAIIDGNLELVNHLFTQCSDSNFENLDEDGNSLMHIAVISKHLEIVRYLAEHNVPLYAVNKDGETPLHIAAKLGLLLIVDYIIDVGPNLLKFVDKNGNTPLHLACLTNHSNVALSLCNAGATLEVRNKDRKTPLLCAVITSSESCVRVLLLAGARVDITDEEGNTALHLAAIQGDYLIVKLLSKAVSNVDIFNTSEFTPLHLAAKHGHLRTVRYLILAGADPSITSRNGITPDVMAYAQGHSKVGMLLTKMKPEKCTAWIEQLRQGTHRMPRIKLKLFGSSLVGKTQLTHSLYTGPISAYLKKKLTTVSDFAGLTGEVSPKSSLYRHQYPYMWDIEAEHENYTHGIDVHITNEYTLWDFSGFPSYYCFYDHFIGDISCIHLVLFNLMDSLEWRRRSVRFWLDFLYARIPVKGPLLFGGRPTEMARIILVGTHADVVQCQKDQNGLYYDEETLLFLKEIILEYQDKLDIHEIIYLLDARDGTSLEMKQLKTYLTDVRNIIIQTLPRTNSLMIDLSNKLPEWTVNDVFPICNLDEFAERVHEHINPLCTDEHLVTLIEHLQYAGNILYIQTTSRNTTVNNSSAVTSDDNDKYYYYKDDLVILNPNQLCSGILGKCFSERFLHRTRITGSFTLDDIQLFVREQDTQILLKLLESFGLCVCCIVKEHRHLKSRNKKKHSTDCFELFEQISSSPLSRPLTPDIEHTDRNGNNYNSNNNNNGNNDLYLSNNTQFPKTIVFDISKLNNTSITNEEIQIEMPRLNQIPLYQGLWDNNNNENKRMIYSGLQLITSPGQFIHLMPRIQVQLRREISMNRKKLIQTKLSNQFDRLTLKGYHNGNQNINNHFYTISELYLNSLDFNLNNNNDNHITNSIYNKRRTKHSHSWNLVQWLHGSKITDSKGEIQIFLCIDEYKQVLDIFSRCLPCHIHQTFSLLHETVHLITQVISKCCPNLDLELKLLNSNDLSKHYKNPKVWDSRQLTQTLLFLVAQNSHSHRTSLCSIDLHKPRTSENQRNQYSTDLRYLHDNDNDNDDDVNIGEDEGEKETNDEESYEENIFNTNININNTNIKQRKNRASDHTVHLQNQLKKDLFFNNNELAQEVSNHLLNIPSYPLPPTILQKLAKQIDINERDPYKFKTFIQCLCYPEMINLITQWNQGISLWSTLSPTVILLIFSSKYPIRFLEWALLSSYGINIVQLLYTSYILLNFSQIIFKESSMKSFNKDKNDDIKEMMNHLNHSVKFIRSSSTPRNSQM
ncbi:unnamed protein product [Schistosoma rodhaini]|uniref:Non-specific serine/threonine protein kinase n=1 Tax=Schistosoma rodhaini TaxID=6188 RepID=A0AA85EVG4_9TREM|nr:unnamed protein product [Schistosoma rodhaini]